MKPLDTTKGVITRDIYESGHIDSPLICPDKGEAVKLLIIITSAPVHREARLAIRQTWGHFGTRRDIAIAFLVGAAGQSLDDAIVAENYMYNDLIRGRFVDSYNNLTLKTISMLEWVDEYCPKASFVLKTDDGKFFTASLSNRDLTNQAYPFRHVYKCPEASSVYREEARRQANHLRTTSEEVEADQKQEIQILR